MAIQLGSVLLSGGEATAYCLFPECQWEKLYVHSRKFYARQNAKHGVAMHLRERHKITKPRVGIQKELDQFVGPTIGG